ncbi:MAG TPA: aldolase/citrate lyase family protein [Candidatus Koribacter sp.]|jgi:citrate lyase subunit beta/citryl-CoA lyase
MAATAETVLRGEAGRVGKDVRSDLHVIFEPRTSGGVEIELKSRVAIYYGENIRRQTREILAQLGVVHGFVKIVDEGALPFVISARLETAVKRSGVAAGKRALPTSLPFPLPSAKDRVRRSRLYLPGNEPKYFINAGLHAPDGVILDLEDSVHAAEKDAARFVVRNALRSVDFLAAERMVRINQLPLGLADLEEIIPQSPDVILIPKVETAEQVAEIDGLITAICEIEHIDRPIWLMPILESALGIENAYAIAKASPRNCALTIGLEDYTADLGVVKTKDGSETLYARQRLANSARAAGIIAIDSVYGDVADMDGLRFWGERSRAMGFEGMGCIHPLQIRVIHEAFAPSAAEIEKALIIVGAFDQAQRQGLGVVSLGSKMIDPPVVHRALKLVDRARSMGLVPKEGQQ